MLLNTLAFFIFKWVCSYFLEQRASMISSCTITHINNCAFSVDFWNTVLVKTSVDVFCGARFVNFR